MYSCYTFVNLRHLNRVDGISFLHEAVGGKKAPRSEPWTDGLITVERRKRRRRNSRRGVRRVVGNLKAKSQMPSIKEHREVPLREPQPGSVHLDSDQVGNEEFISREMMKNWST